jgi:hypothetical protein
MADLTVRLELSFGARSMRALMAAAMIFSAVSEVASESVTLTTYYPAPSGVYTQMIVTGNTYLARDSGDVGIGTANPVAPLDVSNTTNGSGGYMHLAGATAPTLTTQGAYIGWNALSGGMGETDFMNNQGGGPGGFAFFNGAQHTTPAVFIAGTGSVGIGTVSPGGTLDVEGAGNVILNAGKVGVGTASPGQVLDVVGSARATDLIASDDGGSHCAETSYQINGYTDCSASGIAGPWYATLTSGVIADMTLMPAYEATANIGSGLGTAVMFCCTCPTSGCPSLP